MRKFIVILFILTLITPICAVGARRIAPADDTPDYVPPPVLLNPIGGEVDLRGRDALEFKWSPHEGLTGIREYYDFRLYKGHNTIEEALIMKKRLAGDAYQFNVNSDRFEDGRVYTWFLRQVYSGSRKSHARFISFKVIKK